LRRARAAPSARLGFLIRVRQHAIFQGRRCGQDTGPQRRVAEDAQRLKTGRRNSSLKLKLKCSNHPFIRT
jgi:hypothetical protein